MLNFDQVQIAIAAARRRYDLICQKYPSLKTILLNTNEIAAYLVLSLPGGQTGINSSPKEILTKFPKMIVNNDTKASALELLTRIEKSEWKTAPRSEIELLQKQLQPLLPHLKYHGQCQIEIRFNDLTYDLIWKLQTDDLIDRNLTPQTKASIRIVLGTLAQFTEII